MTQHLCILKKCISLYQAYAKLARAICLASEKSSTHTSFGQIGFFINRVFMGMVMQTLLNLYAWLVPYSNCSTSQKRGVFNTLERNPRGGLLVYVAISRQLKSPRKGFSGHMNGFMHTQTCIVKAIVALTVLQLSTAVRACGFVLRLTHACFCAKEMSNKAACSCH